MNINELAMGSFDGRAVDFNRIFTPAEKQRVCAFVTASNGNLPKLASDVDEFCRPLADRLSKHGLTVEDMVSAVVVAASVCYAMAIRANAQSNLGIAFGTQKPRFNTDAFGA